MSHIRYSRKYPRTHIKQLETNKDECTLSLSAMAAAGMLALVFTKGLFWGYMLKKRLR
ncbi:MAG: hypothetical protein GX992_02280 [Clostridium sp.]|nr:hypothetical protein [Clostridium sp.]